MVTRDIIQLSTTEPNYNIPKVRIIQDDRNTQKITAEIIEDGELANFLNKAVFFNATVGTYKVRSLVEDVDYNASRVTFTITEPYLQKLGEFSAWLSFADSEEVGADQFSTMKFTYTVYPGVTCDIKEGNYFWELEELVAYYQRYKYLISTIVENEDFSGLMTKIAEIDARTSELPNYSVATTAEAQAGTSDKKLMTPKKTFDLLGANGLRTATRTLTPFDFTEGNLDYGQGHFTRIGDIVFFNARWTSAESAVAGSSYYVLTLPTGYRNAEYEVGISAVAPFGHNTIFARVGTDHIVEVRPIEDGQHGYSLTGHWRTTDKFPE